MNLPTDVDEMLKYIKESFAAWSLQVCDTYAGAEEAAEIWGGGQNMVPGHIYMEKNYNLMEWQ